MWQDISNALQVYGLGDLKVGHLTYIVLTGILIPWKVLWSRMVGSWTSIMFGGCRFALQARTWLMNQLKMLQRAKIIWDNNLLIQQLSDDMEFEVTYKITDKILS